MIHFKCLSIFIIIHYMASWLLKEERVAKCPKFVIFSLLFSWLEKIVSGNRESSCGNKNDVAQQLKVYPLSSVCLFHLLSEEHQACTVYFKTPQLTITLLLHYDTLCTLISLILLESLNRDSLLFMHCSIKVCSECNVHLSQDQNTNYSFRPFQKKSVFDIKNV